MSQSNGHSSGHSNGHNGNGQKHRRNTSGLRPPWKPGECPNPGGRPKGTSLTARLRAALDEDGASEAVVMAGVKAARRGDFRFWQAIFDRVEGKIVDNVRQTVDGEFIIRYVDEDSLRIGRKHATKALNADD